MTARMACADVQKIFDQGVEGGAALLAVSTLDVVAVGSSKWPKRKAFGLDVSKRKALKRPIVAARSKANECVQRVLGSRARVP